MPSSKSVAIIGQGYVGLPLAYALCKAGYQVQGIDSDALRVRIVAEGKSPIEDVSDAQVLEMITSGRFAISQDISLISISEAVVICVPTPIDNDQVPDLTALREAVTSVAQSAKPGALIINESTSYPGTVRNLIFNIFKKIRPEEEFDFACAPERVDPGNKTWGHQNTPRLVGGLSERALARAEVLYRDVCAEVVKVSSPEVAELAKLLENSFRQVNIALVTEFARIAHKASVDIHEVIDAAATKPYGFMKFVPSIGVGGHCIPVDPMYLSWFARENGLAAELVDVAQKINNSQPLKVADRAEELLGEKKGKILILGMGYKPKTGDTRESPSVEVLYLLRKRGHEVKWRDSFVKEFTGEKSHDSLLGFDLIIIAQSDSSYNSSEFISQDVKVLDCTGALRHIPGVFQL
jgi:UDP-N-acetyl-D-glucosamine dehydrogenase